MCSEGVYNLVGFFLKLSRGNVMAGRKRKIVALTVASAPVKAVNKHENGTDLKPKASPAKLKKPSQCESAQSAETERSHYFTKNELQHRLREDFFNLSCISLGSWCI